MKSAITSEPLPSVKLAVALTLVPLIVTVHTADVFVSSVDAVKLKPFIVPISLSKENSILFSLILTAFIPSFVVAVTPTSTVLPKGTTISA